MELAHMPCRCSLLSMTARMRAVYRFSPLCLRRSTILSVANSKSASAKAVRKPSSWGNTRKASPCSTSPHPVEDFLRYWFQRYRPTSSRHGSAGQIKQFWSDSNRIFVQSSLKVPGRSPPFHQASTDPTSILLVHALGTVFSSPTDSEKLWNM